MEILYPYKEQFQEIVKICRLCGNNNKENIDIFASKPISSRSEDLLTKILTVYPLVLYKDDPLPQYICPICIGNVSTTYQDIQQVLRQQTKWMNLTKAAQPEHKYFRILNAIENSTQVTKESIKKSYNIELSTSPLKKLLITNPSTDYENNTTTNSNSKLSINESVVKNIQNKLESNGFTIKRIKVPATTDIGPEVNDNTNSSDDTQIVSCKYCKLSFSDLKILAQHQLIHLKVSANKVFQRHLLHKQLRRGRLITINDNKCIRCLNCWRIFKDNKTILQHWSGGECEFYCFVCGKEFPHSPKMLREHVSGAHGISYRNVNRALLSNKPEQNKPLIFSDNPLRAANLLTKVKKVYKKPPPKSCTKNDDGTIQCKICHKVFDNFRSSNSHMRKHKPPVRFSDKVASPANQFFDNYNFQDDHMAQPSTSNFHYGNHNPNSSSAANFLHMKPPRPAYRVIMKNGPLRGIKTKIVQKRHDFLTNYANNERSYPVQTSMSASSNADDDDDENMIIPEIVMPVIKCEPLLEDIELHNKDSNDFENPNNHLRVGIKSEPLDTPVFVETQQAQICFICNESFGSKRDFELHSMFVHNIN